MGVKNKGYREAQKRFEKGSLIFDALSVYYCEIAANELKSLAALNTPVVTGHLRRSWQTGPVEKERGHVSAKVFNLTNYGIHVEYGHRIIRNGEYVGYVPGQYFFRHSLDQFKPMFQKICSDFQQEINKALGGGG